MQLHIVRALESFQTKPHTPYAFVLGDKVEIHPSTVEQEKLPNDRGIIIARGIDHYGNYYKVEIMNSRTGSLKTYELREYAMRTL